MFNVCPACGAYHDDKEIDPSGPFAICPACGHRHRFLRLPLFVITGASGAGKTSVCLHLLERLPECVVLENDILWRAEFITADDDYREYHNLWLRVVKNIHQSGRPVVLCGTAVPAQLDACTERRYIAEIHILALTCDEALLVERLQSRPTWRQSAAPEFVARMVQFNRWLRDHARCTEPPMTLLDTSRLTIDEAADQTAAWVRSRLAPAPGPS